MKTTEKERRLRAIKPEFVFSLKTCHCCKKDKKFKIMWSVSRYTRTSGYFRKYYYCKDCMPTAENVLQEIDTDNIQFGIATIDNRFLIK